MKPVAIDLFSGAGLMGLGFSQAGFDVRVAVELSPVHAKAHRRNFPSTKVLCRSVVGLSKFELYQAAGLHWRDEVDLILGGSPCQAFSVQGKKLVSDPRRSLLYEFIRVVGEVRPKHFVFENVKGLTVGKDRVVLENAIAEFDRAGYDCAPWRVLNAKDYGVAQSRERMFLLGSRRDRPLIEYPHPTGKPPTCWDVLHDLEDPTRAALLSGNLITVHTDEVCDRFANVEPGKMDARSKFKRLHPDGLAPTLTAGTSTGSHLGGRHTAKRPIHYKFPRVCTVRELARLHGIPDWVELGNPVSSICDAAMQIGNSVPPPLARAVAIAVLDAIALHECEYLAA